MTTTIDDILSPRNIAIVGASDNPLRIGGRPLSTLLKHEFDGGIFPVNPTRDQVQGRKSYRSLSEIPETPDFVLIAVPAAGVNDVLREAVRCGSRTALIFSAGFAEAGPEGERRQEEMRSVSRESGIRILGPNCIGSFNPHRNFYPTFSTAMDWFGTKPGDISIASQSGAIGTHIYTLMGKRGLACSHLVTTGNEVDVHVTEVIRMLVRDNRTQTIIGYAEAFRDGPMLIETLQEAREARKPVILLKSGRSTVGAQAIGSHTASLAGDDAVVDAVLRQYGAYRASSVDELIDLAAATTPRVFPTGRRIGIITPSGGGGIMMADAAEQEGLDVAEMPADAQAEIKAEIPFASAVNPIDLSAQISNQLDSLPAMVRTMITKGGYDSLAGFWTTMPNHPDMGAKLREALFASREGRAPILFPQSMIASAETLRDYQDNGFPAYEDMDGPIHAVAVMTYFGESFAARPEERPDTISVPVPDGDIGEYEGKKILITAGLAMAQDILVRDRQAARDAVCQLGPAAMKIASPDIAHKSDIGGVALSVTPELAEGTFDTIMKNVSEKAPQARVDGVIISPMVTGGVELILGGRVDPVFGPMVLIGMGGIFTEVMKDMQIRHAPFGPQTARDMVEKLHCLPLLKGVRGTEPVDLNALCEAISIFSRVFSELADAFDSVEINPLLARADGPIGLDAAFSRKPGKG